MIASGIFFISLLNKVNNSIDFKIDIIFSLFAVIFVIKFCNWALLFIDAVIFFIILLILFDKLAPSIKKFPIRFNESFNISFNWLTLLVSITSINWVILVVFKIPLRYCFWVSKLDLISDVLFWIRNFIWDISNTWANLGVNKFVKFSKPSNKIFINVIFKSITLIFNSFKFWDNNSAYFVTLLVNIS